MNQVAVVVIKIFDGAVAAGFKKAEYGVVINNPISAALIVLFLMGLIVLVLDFALLRYERPAVTRCNTEGSFILVQLPNRS